MTSGETLKGIISDRKVSLAARLDFVSGVVLVELVAGAGAGGWDDEDGGGGDGGGGGGEVVDFCDVVRV